MRAFSVLQAQSFQGTVTMLGRGQTVATGGFQMFMSRHLRHQNQIMATTNEVGETGMTQHMRCELQIDSRKRQIDRCWLGLPFCLQVPFEISNGIVASKWMTQWIIPCRRSHGEVFSVLEHMEAVHLLCILHQWLLQQPAFVCGKHLLYVVCHHRSLFMGVVLPRD